MRPRRISRTFKTAALVLVSGIALLPLLWGISTALKTADQIQSYPPHWLPAPPSFQSFVDVWTQSNLPVYFRNSVGVTVSSVLLSLLIAVHAAYGLSRYRFRGKAILLTALLATSMIPGIAILVPLYHLSVQTGLYDTFTGLVLVYSAWNIPILVWLLKGFFDTIPQELEEAALIDGCTRLRAFYLIVLPMARPGLLSGALMAMMFVWNDFLITFALTISEDKRLLSVGLYTYISSYGIDWGQLMSATIIALAPVCLVFFLLQRYMISGLMSGAVKG
jgi:ABC-type glycerol-3-phosphate transport system permease component